MHNSCESAHEEFNYSIISKYYLRSLMSVPVGQQGGQRATCWAGIEQESRICPLGLLKIFSLTARETFSNSQMMLSLNSWLAQGKSWANIPPAIN